MNTEQVFNKKGSRFCLSILHIHLGHIFKDAMSYIGVEKFLGLDHQVRNAKSAKVAL